MAGSEFASSSFNATYGNGSMGEDPYLEAPLKQILITVFVVIFALSLFGNFLVVFVIARNKSMHTVTNFFLANLAFADLLVAVFCVIPQLLWYVLESWPLGLLICRLHKYMTSAATTASILILTVISVERYIAILHPLETRRVLTSRRLTITVMLVWMLSAVVNIPVALFYNLLHYGDNKYCTPSTLSEGVARVHSILFCVFFYTIPLLIMAVLYGIISRKLWTTSTGKRVFTSGEDSGFQRGKGSRFTSRITGRFSKAKAHASNHSSTSNAAANIYRPDNDTEGTVVLEITKDCNKKDGNVKSKLEEVSTEPPKNQKIGPFFVHEPTDDLESTPGTEMEVKVPLTANEGNNNSNGKKDDTTNISAVSGSKRTGRKAPDPKLTRNQSSMSVGKDRSSKRANDEISSGRSRGKGRSNVMAARKKVIRLLVFIVVSFALCLFPVQLQTFWQAFGHSTFLSSQGGIYFLPFSQALYFFNSALNPFLYAFFSDNFRAKFKQTLKLGVQSNRASMVSRSALQRLPSMTSYAQTETVYVST
ncbi:galanin receptor type 1 [Strongylocentrotus purpuratus]|uniref:G-protein coupled receptors family 1 profile domain-containing protein n=1 Tax=Strongylocentrotus purpuratus TaxID=7668 RepID=A0A7M7NMQ7_STRPU|nr:galanin receptor type 1 [Strongylocentrotus purpuratus]|eukprot:XP_003725376.1 PREDICTED: galanin receptor type 1 [Strongylocentrotus purpuratus]